MWEEGYLRIATFSMYRSVIILLASLLFSILCLFYLYKTSPNDMKMRTIYPTFKLEEHNLDHKNIKETVYEKLLKNITFQDPNQDLVNRLHWDIIDTVYKNIWFRCIYFPVLPLSLLTLRQTQPVFHQHWKKSKIWHVMVIMFAK